MPPLETERPSGFAAGLVGGLVFAIVAVIISVATGDTAVEPFRYFASLCFGDLGYREYTAGPPLVGHLVFVGALVHVVMSLVVGRAYAILDSRVLRDTPDLSQRALLGAGFGLAVWAINFQVLGRVLFPWFLALPQAAWAAMHALGFGVPMAIAYGLIDRYRAAHPASV